MTAHAEQLAIAAPEIDPGPAAPELGDVCECGHARRAHIGPCIGVYGEGRSAHTGSVCPCLGFHGPAPAELLERWLP
jgi:hypothetical protein